MADGPRQTQTFLDILTRELVFLLLDFNLLSCPGICNVFQSVCMWILNSSTSRRILHGDANLIHLHRNRLLREIESRGCGAHIFFTRIYKNLVQDVRQICASRHMFWFGCYLKVSPLASLGLQFFTSAAIPRDALFRINISNAAPCDRVSIMKQWWKQICTRNCVSSRNDH